MIKPTRKRIVLESSREETADTHTFVFSLPYAHEPGQFITLGFADAETIGRRSFSIASGPGEQLELTVKRVGSFTDALFRAARGTVFESLGPLGLPHIRNREDPHVLIAGGSGIAPFRSLARDPRSTALRLTLIDSNRTYSDIIYRDELEHWNIPIIHTLTREPHEGMRFGRIDMALLGSVEDIAQQRIIICGPPGLVSSTIEHLLTLGVPPSRIRTESWGN